MNAQGESRAVWWTAGIDAGEERHRVVLVDQQGSRRRSLWVRNRFDEIEEAIAGLVVQLPEGVGLRLVSEGDRALRGVLSQVATQLGAELWQVNPKALAHYRELEGQPRKDDDIDAWLAARMCVNRMAGCRRVVDVRTEERVLARLSRLHLQLTRKKTQAWNQLRARMLELAPEVLSREWQGPAFVGKGMLAVLTRWPAFRGLASAHLATVERVIRGATRYGDASRAMAAALRSAAARVRLANDERWVVELEMRTLVAELRALDASLAEVDRQIEERVDAHPVGDKLRAMPAVGYLTAATQIGELLPLARNCDEGSVATYAGLTPLSRTSGKSKGRSRLARGVNKHALRANYLSALAATQDSPLDREYFRRQLERHQGHPKPHVAALLSLTRQRFKVIFKLMTTEATYDPQILIGSHLERERRNALAATS